MGLFRTSNSAGLKQRWLIMANERQSVSQRGGSGNFANDPERASEAGKEGRRAFSRRLATERHSFERGPPGRLARREWCPRSAG